MKADVQSLTKGKLGRRVLQTVAILAILSVVAIGILQAGPPPPPPRFAFSVTDPVGDQAGTIDVTGMQMTFEHDKFGSYTIVLTADTAHPFTGKFRVSINLYNPGAPAGDTFFSHVCQHCGTFSPGPNKDVDFDLGSKTQTTLIVPGKNDHLLNWDAGDQVATTTATVLGNPLGISLFRSSVTQPLLFPGTPLTHEDVIGYDDPTAGTDGSAAGFINGNGTSGKAAIVAVP